MGEIKFAEQALHFIGGIILQLTLPFNIRKLVDDARERG